MRLNILLDLILLSFNKKEIKNTNPYSELFRLLAQHDITNINSFFSNLKFYKKLQEKVTIKNGRIVFQSGTCVRFGKMKFVYLHVETKEKQSELKFCLSDSTTSIYLPYCFYNQNTTKGTFSSHSISSIFDFFNSCNLYSLDQLLEQEDNIITNYKLFLKNKRKEEKCNNIYEKRLNKSISTLCNEYKKTHGNLTSEEYALFDSLISKNANTLFLDIVSFINHHPNHSLSPITLENMDQFSIYFNKSAPNLLDIYYPDSTCGVSKCQYVFKYN